MGTCEHLAEPACTSSQMLMVDEVEELVGSPLGERLGKWVVEPISSLDIVSQAPQRSRNYSVLLSVSDHGLGPLEAEDGDTTEPCLMPINGDTNCEVMADVNLEIGNVSSIKLGLSRICFDETQCKSEISPCSSNKKDSSDEDQVLSEVLPVASALSGYTEQNDKSLVEVVSNNTFIQAVDDGPSKGLLVPDEVKLNGVVTDVVESSDHVDKEGKSNARKDNSICEFNCPDAPPLSLRRSSRARKSLQKVQGGKHATKCTKKASSLSLGGNIDLFSKATRKKRSCLSRSLCLSGWGLSVNLLKYFELSNEVGINKALDEGLKKGKTSQRSRKKNVLKVVSNSKSSEVRQEVPCRPIRLKVTFGKKVEQNKVDSCSYTERTGGNVMNGSVQKEMHMLKRCSNSVEDIQFPGTDIHSMLENSTHTDLLSLEPEKLSGTHIDKYLDPGTSPDSEVIDQVLDSTIGNGSSPLPLRKSKKKIKKKDKVCEASNPGMEDKQLCNASTYKAKMSKKGGQQQKKSDGFCTTDAGITSPSENPSSNTSCSGLISMDFLSPSDEGPHKGTGLESGADSNMCSWMGVGVESADSGNSCQLLLHDKTQGNRNSNSSKAKGKSRNKSKVTDATRNQREPAGQLKVSKRKSTSKCKVKKNDLSDKGHQSETGKFATVDVGKTDASHGPDGLAPENLSCQAVLPTKVGVQILPSRNAWVCCDDCHKWRCIAAELADVIEETNSRWTCKDNQDQAFADCSIPQEKSDADINAELQISDEEDARHGQLGSKASGIRHAVASQPSAWMLIKSNLYLHRSRKTQTMDEIMVCDCKPPVDGGLGCSSQCLNTMLNIECVQGTCPCGDLCSNQKFQKRQYSKLSCFRCGKKGYGLQVLEDISKGQFLIEYIGEVLDLQTYEARQKEYASQGHKHFYFMTLNGNEVIDACAKGNLGRFVNHSCDPNCLTEKWVVNGEICVGLFARRNIRKGEELTFDYNYVRVFGAAAKKCHCGSPKCRGYIGGDPLNAEVVVQGDSDDEFPEPVVVNENGEINHNLENMMTKIKSVDVELGPNADDLCEGNLKVILDGGEISKMEKSPIDVGELLPTSTKKEAIDEVHESSDNLAALQTEDVKNEALSAAKQLTSTTEQTISTSTSSPVSDVSSVRRIVKNLLSGSIDSGGRMSEVDIVECERPPSKPRARMKISRQFKSVKNRKSSNVSASAEKDIVMAHRFQVLSYKPKKLVEGSANCHLEGVEEKLNELLDADGGICKRKDASKGYLKLLLLTAASGDSCNGGAIQSNRDLSMILDAILKTKSRGVLLDVINKNGLQMLHNMMKLYRKDFKKIPILRKLLKVLEFLAEEEILTIERINGEPIHPGVESFRESILSFTEHEDKKVHQIARNFRDRWIQRHMRKFFRMEKADRKRELNRSLKSDRFYGTHHHWRDHGARPTEPMDCSKQLVVLNNPTDISMQEASSPQLCDSQPIMSRPRKRKTRWDQDKPSSPKKIKTSPKAEISGGVNQTADVSGMADGVMQNSEDDGPPPGFSSPQNSDGAPPGPIMSRPRKRKSRWDQDKPSSPRKTKTCPKAEINGGVNQTAEVSGNVDDVMWDSEDDAPPGFSLQKTEDAPPGFSSPLSLQSSSPIKCPSEIYMGHLQERFNSHLPVAYGIPFSITEQLGTLQSGTVDSWTVAPSIPFQPFPPLPPYPREKRDSPRPCTGHEEMRVDNGDCYWDQGVPSTSGASLMNVQHSTINQHREMGFSNGSESRHYQQQKWNRLDHRVPCHQNRFGLGFKENHPGKGVFDDVNHSVECAGKF